jgi:hypothetical protein
MTRIVRSLMLAFALAAAGALAEAPVQDAFAQGSKPQARAKKKVQRTAPAARAAQPAPAAQARPPAYDPSMRDSGGGGGGY